MTLGRVVAVKLHKETPKGCPFHTWSKRFAASWHKWFGHIALRADLEICQCLGRNNCRWDALAELMGLPFRQFLISFTKCWSNGVVLLVKSIYLDPKKMVQYQWMICFQSIYWRKWFTFVCHSPFHTFSKSLSICFMSPCSVVLIHLISGKCIETCSKNEHKWIT